jgi:hypothetical protein
MLVEHHLGPHQAELRGELIVFVPTPLALRFEALPLVGLLTPAAQGSAGKLYRFSLEP